MQAFYRGRVIYYSAIQPNPPHNLALRLGFFDSVRFDTAGRFVLPAGITQNWYMLEIK